jgi:hypothetical protein
MATYTLISATTLTTTTATVSLTSIPSDYTDLVVRMSARADGAVLQPQMYVYFNNNSTTLHTGTQVQGSGSAATSGSSSNPVFIARINGASSVSNTFNNFEMYVPSYTASQAKPFSGFNVQEDNATAAYQQITAGLYNSTTAISRIDFNIAAGAYSFVSGSSFYLYGISNA